MLIALLPVLAVGLAWRGAWTSAVNCRSTASGLRLLPRPLPVAEP